VREFAEQHARTVGRVLSETGAVDIVDASVVTLGRPRASSRALNDLAPR
jgi:hypothetical protein